MVRKLVAFHNSHCPILAIGRRITGRGRSG